MSKTHLREKSELEHLRGIIKSLKSENRHLRRRMKDLEKKKHLYESTLTDYVEHEYEKKREKCPNCGKGNIKEIDFHHITLMRCTVCNYQDRRRNDGKKESTTDS